MATVVLTAAGSAVAGPLGASVGRVLGRQIDRALRSSGRDGVGDVRLQASHYGAAVPAVFGRMRVAGVLIWASDPNETAVVSKSGAYHSYSISFAVAVSSRPLLRIGRIWADSRLIRDGEGSQDVAFTLRVYDGNEDQNPDPLMAGDRGIAMTPAYRGLSYLVFEDFDLSTFGNRVPMLTFEVEADDGGLTSEALAADLLRLSHSCADANRHDLIGYATGEETRLGAAFPLLTSSQACTRYDKGSWDLSAPEVFHDIPSDLWSTVEDEPISRMRESEGLALRFFDAERDFLASEVRTRVPGALSSSRIELPAAISSEVAKATAQELLARLAGNSSRRLKLPLSFGHIQVGDALYCSDLTGEPLRVAALAFEAGGLTADLAPMSTRVEPIISDSGQVRTAALLATAPLELAVVELPATEENQTLRVAVAVSGGAATYTQRSVSLTSGGFEQNLLSSRLPSAIGKLTQPIRGAPRDHYDHKNVLVVSFIADPFLTSCTEEALLSGANSVAIGAEVLQFQFAEPIGDASYRLIRLLRGRFDTPICEHLTDEKIICLDRDRLAITAAPFSAMGSSLEATAIGTDGSEAAIQLGLTGRAIKPWTPAHLSAQQAGDKLEISWVRRSASGLAWLDFVDAPPASGRAEYRVVISDLLGATLERSVQGASLSLTSAELSILGPKPWQLTVQECGDFGLSRPQTIHIFGE